LSSHSAKASTRLVVNTSPEPVSNVAVSLAEDGLVLTVMMFAIARPELAIVIVALLTIASVIVAIVLYRIARRAGRRLMSGARSAREGGSAIEISGD
jgi:membrane protein DedA with SNARE-associated domain